MSYLDNICRIKIAYMVVKNIDKLARPQANFSELISHVYVHLTNLPFDYDTDSILTKTERNFVTRDMP